MKAKEVLAIAAFAIFALALTGCSRQSTDEPVTRVSVILPHQDDGYWSMILKGINAKTEDANNAGIDIRTFLPQINYNIPQMTDLVRQQIAAKTDVIVVQGNEDQAFVEQLEKAQEQGIRIVCMDTDLESLPEHLYVGTNNYDAGRELGTNLLKIAGDETLTATVISGQKGYPNMADRLAGIQDILEEHGSITVSNVLYDNYDALTFMDQYNSCDSDVVICIEGTGAQTLARMRSDHDERFKYIVGFDMTEALQNNVMDGILTQDTYAIGATIVDELIEFRKEGSYTSDKIYTPTGWHTSDEEGGQS